MLLASMGLAVVATLALTAAWAWAEGAAKAAEGDRAGVARFARTALFLAFGAAYAFLLRRARPPIVEALGFGDLRRAPAFYAAGFVAGILPVVALVCVLLLLGARTFEVRVSGAKLAWFALKFVLLGIPLVLLEESVFRGLLLGDLVRAFGKTAGVIGSSALFAATHFLGASGDWRALPGPVTATDVVVAVFAGMERMFREWPELVGLFLAGAALATLRLRSGALWLGMGVHAGWYWIRRMDRWFVRDVDAVIDAHRTWLGTSQYLDGVIGWFALIATLLLTLTIRLPASRSAEAPGAIP
jgi:uncharacterized protein